MKLSEFDFCLPANLIAQTPAPTRNQSRLMVVDRAEGKISHAIFTALPDYFIGRPLIVLNDTRVIPARLAGKNKETGKAVELLLVREKSPMLWEALVKGLAKLKPGQVIIFDNTKITATMVERRDDKALLRFSAGERFASFLDIAGKLPLPHYIRRDSGNNDRLDELDRERYQTVYANRPGAIAAPTAGLHFTSEMLAEIRERYADITHLTLHVGPGTFQPVRCDDVKSHKMAREEYYISADTWNRVYRAKKAGQNVLAVGTTTTRVLESLDFNCAREEGYSGWTERFIYPGQNFNAVDQLLTNFHLPKSTLYMLVCAFAGKGLMERAYREAVRSEYRFFSYGDAMLIL